MYVLVGLIVGGAIALVTGADVPPEQARYLAIVVLAGVDAAAGGTRAALERTFSDRVFVVSLSTNALLGAALVWLGDQLDLDLTTAVAVVFGIRIFQNVAALRRRYLS
ncbi:MAG: small basic family protein [Acidimicrobiia bacterium]|nr:small basic family protein [Acidimicrobiia bacterium]MBP8179979.1 small basic family protein [Acidimicrobiia bacterium]